MQLRCPIDKCSTLALSVASALTVTSLYFATNTPATAHNATRASAQAKQSEHFAVRPNKKYNMLDCNGWSTTYKSVVPRFRSLCADPHGRHVSGGYGGAGRDRAYWGRFVDNGHYVGHDEPSVKFISAATNSGNTMTYFMRLPKDPTRPPTNDGKVTKYAELTGAAWFGLPLCDPASYPQNPCTPHSDANHSEIDNPNAAGSAFMELQFYAPGFPPFQDSTSCDATRWCAAMTIDSLASEFNFVNLNPACPEPVNFAYLQDNGVPAGPPSPQLADGSTFTPNSHTLMMNPGDALKLAITDPLTGPGAGFTATVTDLTTHQTGYMIASAANGFMNTNYLNCDGSPFTFHAEYATAAQVNQVPWAALEGGVLMEQEIGHNEVCTSLANRDATTGPGLSDPRTYDTCLGGNEGRLATGEGSCDGHTGVCQRATTEGTTGPIACPTDNFASGQLCEYADGTCLPQGPRPITLNGARLVENMPVNFCQANRFQNGDLDYDGVSYVHGTWPNGTTLTPTSFRYAGPFDSSGASYPSIQFETDAPGSAFLCNLATEFNCVVPPLAARFYPFWTMTNKAGQGIGNLFPSDACIWNFGDTILGVTTQRFGGTDQYGQADFARFGGTATSAVLDNPQVNGGCPVLTEPMS